MTEALKYTVILHLLGGFVLGVVVYVCYMLYHDYVKYVKKPR